MGFLLKIQGTQVSSADRKMCPLMIQQILHKGVTYACAKEMREDFLEKMTMNLTLEKQVGPQEAKMRVEQMADMQVVSCSGCEIMVCSRHDSYSHLTDGIEARQGKVEPGSRGPGG